MVNYCIDCEGKVSSGATRCWKCDLVYRTTPEYRQRQACSTKQGWERDGHRRQAQSEKLKGAHARGCYDGVYNEGRQQKIRGAWVRGDFDGVFDSDEFRSKMSKIKKRHWQEGVYEGIQIDREKHSAAVSASWTPARRQAQSKITKQRWADGIMDDVFLSPTSIELEVVTALDDLNISHQSQYRPDGYSRIYDELVYPNTLLEIQGDYFHSEEHFPGIQERDAEKAQWAEDNGYNLVVIWEHEIKERGAWLIIAEAFYATV